MMRKEVVRKLQDKLLGMSLKEIKLALSEDFYNMDHVIEALYYGLTTGKNVILYGPGGFGKSQIVKKFLEITEISSQTIVGNEDTEVDALLGIPNIEKLTKESTYEIAFEKTVFCNEGVLILEEFLDVRPTTAAALKDILSEGGYRRGEEFIESMISSVIICANKSPEEVSVDNSTAAFYKERFPIRVEVAWNSYKTEDYVEFLQLIRDDYKELSSYYEVLAEIASRTSMDNIVSPRVVKDAADLLSIHKDITVLQYVDGLDTMSIDQIIEYCRYTNEKISLKTIATQINDWINNKEPTNSVIRILNTIEELEYINTKLSMKKVENPNNQPILLELITRCNNEMQKLRSNLHGDISDKIKEQLDLLIDDTTTEADN